MSREIFRLAYTAKMAADAADTGELMLYGEIVSDGPEWWKWSKEDKSAAEFGRDIKKLKESGAKNLLIRINSPGGVCTEAVAMRSILANAGFETINIRIEGMCASAATDIATLPGAHVQIAEGSEYMIHNPWCLAIGDSNELEHTVEHLRNIEDMTRGFYTKKTGQSEEQIKKWMDAETWFTAQQAVDNGFADELLEAQVGTPAAACASVREYEVMMDLYRSIPDEVAIEDDAPEKDVKEKKEDETVMDGNTITPEMLEQARQEAVAAERQRIEEIDALTTPGYEELAAKAKTDGMSAMDFHKQIIAAMKQKGAAFLEQRKEETAPAQDVTGGAPVSGKSEADEIKEIATSVAEYAKTFTGGADGMF